MKRIKIFTKTFITILSLMLGAVLIAYLLLYQLMPMFYKEYKASQLDGEINAMTADKGLSESGMKDFVALLAEEYDLNAVITDQWGNILLSVVTENNYLYSSVDSMTDIQQWAVSADYEIESSVSYTGTESVGELNRTYAVSINGNDYSISICLPLQPLHEAKNVLGMIFPISALLCLIISLVGSCFFASYITKPIKSMARTTALMSELSSKQHIKTNRTDEIGELADSINGMYDKLACAINGLEQKIREVQESEAYKIDFLRTASHELKTPLSSVNALLEGMLYNVPPYDDRDTYIKRCQDILSSANNLIKNTLDLSDEISEETVINLGEAVSETAGLMSLIAMQRQITLAVSIPDEIEIRTRAESFRKALSNIISNAVNFSEPKGRVTVDFADGMLTVFNTCKPLSDDELKIAFEPFGRISSADAVEDNGNGLGMSIIQRALKLCGIDFAFVPSENGDGMVFVCDLKNKIL